MAVNMKSGKIALVGAVVTFQLSLLMGCSSDGYSGGSNVSTHTSFYYSNGFYNDPYYWRGGPTYVVVPPPRPPIDNLPERPTTLPAPAGPGTLPARPSTPGTLPAAPSASLRSRMPSAQPRTSTRSSRPSIPSAPRGMSRGGGGRRGR